MIYTTPSTSRVRAFLVRWTIPAWLSLTTHALIIHQLSLSDLSKKTLVNEDSAELQILDDRVAALEQPDVGNQPSLQMVTQSEFDRLDDAFYLSVNDIRKTLAATATRADLQALQQHIQALEAKLQQPVASLPPVKPKHKIRKALPPQTPTFQIIGRELRGGERFLSIAPIGAQSLEQGRVMRIGETHDGWMLEGFDDHSAVFLFNGETRQLNIR